MNSIEMIILHEKNSVVTAKNLQSIKTLFESRAVGVELSQYWKSGECILL